MKLFNTMTQSVEPFTPRTDTTRIYVCGVTPYDTTHLGHAFTFASFDTLIRYLKSQGQQVKYVQNVTDIDDDVLRKARELGMSWDELGRQETARYLRDMDALNVARPDVYAKATEEVPAIIEIIERLLAEGYAYVSQGCVFYSVDKDPEFGGLARAIGLNTYQEMLEVANERGNFPDDRRKKDPLDFVLWQKQAPGEPAWESPWGPGRPGWHVECSAMVLHYLGSQIDIHGGGYDLAFPHHTCEIAQSEHATGDRPLSQVWMHVAMVFQDGEKMSKSLGNLTLVSNLLKEYSPDAIRWMLLGHHYRSSWEYKVEELVAATGLIDRFAYLRQLVGREHAGEDLVLRAAFDRAMQEDLDTPSALYTLAHALEQAIESQNLQTGAEALRLARVLGLCV